MSEETTPQSEAQTDDDKRFTQSDVNYHVAEGIRKTKEKHAEELAKFADYDELKSKVETLTQELSTKDTELTEALQRAEASDQTTSELRQTLASTKIEAKAEAMGFIDPSDALQTFGDLSSVFDPEKGLDESAIEKHLTDLAKTKKHWVNKPVEKVESNVSDPRPIEDSVQETEVEPLDDLDKTVTEFMKSQRLPRTY